MPERQETLDRAIDNPLWDMNELPPSWKRRIASGVATIEYAGSADALWDHLRAHAEASPPDGRWPVEVRTLRPYLLAQDRRRRTRGRGEVSARAVVVAEMEASENRVRLHCRLAFPGSVVGYSVGWLMLLAGAGFVAWRVGVSFTDVRAHPLKWGLLFVVLVQLYWFLVEIPRALREWDHPALRLLRSLSESAETGEMVSLRGVIAPVGDGSHRRRDVRSDISVAARD